MQGAAVAQQRIWRLSSLNINDQGLATRAQQVDREVDLRLIELRDYRRDDVSSVVLVREVVRS